MGYSNNCKNNILQKQLAHEEFNNCVTGVSQTFRSLAQRQPYKNTQNSAFLDRTLNTPRPM